MTAPRIEVDLDKLGHNAEVLVDRLAGRGVGVTGVTKVVLGAPEVARVLLAAGVTALGDSRIENIERMRVAGIGAPMTLIRSPMPSQCARVVASADRSHNTDFEVVSALSAVADDRGVVHGVVLMVELGDLREGVMPQDVAAFAAAMERLPGVTLVGLGTNLACRNGVVPDDRNMTELSQLVVAVEARLGRPVELVSGGNSAAVDWASGTKDVGRVNDLRLGESILLGREPLHRRPIDGLHPDVFTIVAEVIESKVKPSQPWGSLAQTAFGAPNVETPADVAESRVSDGPIVQTILALGEQDVDPGGLEPPSGVTILGASSDHLVVQTEHVLDAGALLRFQPNYSALLRAMTSPFVEFVTLVGSTTR